VKPGTSATKDVSRQIMADGMGWTGRIVILIVVLVILAAVGLAIYASHLSPPHHTYEQVVPNDRPAG